MPRNQAWSPQCMLSKIYQHAELAYQLRAVVWRHQVHFIRMCKYKHTIHEMPLLGRSALLCNMSVWVSTWMFTSTLRSIKIHCMTPTQWAGFCDDWVVCLVARGHVPVCAYGGKPVARAYFGIQCRSGLSCTQARDYSGYRWMHSRMHDSALAGTAIDDSRWSCMIYALYLCVYVW